MKSLDGMDDVLCALRWLRTGYNEEWGKMSLRM